MTGMWKSWFTGYNSNVSGHEEGKSTGDASIPVSSIPVSPQSLAATINEFYRQVMKRQDELLAAESA